MGIWDNVKNFMNIDTGEFEEETDKNENSDQEYYESSKKREPKIFQPDRKKAMVPPQMQVVIVKPDHFEDVTMIADHLNAKKSVVLNLENANRETSRRILDFISGVAYANRCSIRKVANSTFMIAPNEVDVMGELLSDEYTR